MSSPGLTLCSILPLLPSIGLDPSRFWQRLYSDVRNTWSMSASCRGHHLHALLACPIELVLILLIVVVQNQVKRVWNRPRVGSEIGKLWGLWYGEGEQEVRLLCQDCLKVVVYSWVSLNPALARMLRYLSCGFSRSSSGASSGNLLVKTKIQCSRIYS
jgi:hypothetical protein